MEEHIPLGVEWTLTLIALPWFPVVLIWSFGGASSALVSAGVLAGIYFVTLEAIAAVLNKGHTKSKRHEKL